MKRRMLKRLYFEALRLVRADTRALRRHAERDELLVLNLHSVSPESNPYGPSLHPDALAALLSWLAPRATIAQLSDLPGDNDRDTTRPFVVLSFDDGLKDFAEHAMPVLESFGLRANQNVIGESVETGEPPWAVRLVDLLGAAPTESVRRLRVPNMACELRGDSDLAKEHYGAALTNHLKQMAPADRAAAWATVQETLGTGAEGRPTRMMSAADVAAAHRAGHEIGSHSYSHESMEHLNDDAFLADFRRSRDVLDRAGCTDCSIYAFPNGSHRPGQTDLLRTEGVRHVLLVDERASRPSATVHPRLTVRGHSAAELRARAASAIGMAG